MSSKLRFDPYLIEDALVGVEVGAQLGVVLLDDDAGGLLDRLGADATHGEDERGRGGPKRAAETDGGNLEKEKEREGNNKNNNKKGKRAKERTRTKKGSKIFSKR